jgi:hypothetical protein
MNVATQSSPGKHELVAKQGTFRVLRVPGRTASVDTVDVCSLATENFLSKVDTSKNGLIELDEFTAAIQSDPSILELVANTVFGGIFSSNHGADWPSASAHGATSSQSKVGSDRT